MADAPLLDPQNRLLSWSTGDLSLYGGQTSPGLDIGPAPSTPAGTISVPAPPAVEPAASTVPLSPVTSVVFDDSSSEAPDVSAPNGSGPSAFLPSPLSIEAPAAALTSGAPSTVAFVQDFAPARIAESAGSPSSTAPVGASDAIASSALATSLSAPVLVQQVADIAAASGDGLALAVSADALSAPVLDTVADAGTVLAALDAPIESPALESIVETLATGDTVVATATGAVDDATDLLDLGGTDPTAGLTTLVDMVEAADAFNLTQVDLDGPPEDAASSMLDTLTVDVPELPALLGEAEDHDGAVAGAVDTGEDLLGGL